MAAIKSTPAHSDLLSLPFDQYSRQFIVAHLINTALRSAPKSSLKIIDLGGHKGKTHEFLPADELTILDVFDESYPGYVKGDATKMTFADDTFDIATSFDVFEHIPRGSRQAFIDEALRVSKLGVFIALPVDAGEGAVTGAEALLNQFHNDLYNEDHRWLKEHIDYHIPNHNEILALIAKSGAQSASLASNQITDWELLQTLIFIAAKNPHITNAVNNLNRWYNQHIAQLELGTEPGYRRIYFVTKNEQLLKRVEKEVAILAGTEGKEKHRYLKVHESTLAETLRAVVAMGRSFNEIMQASDDHQKKRQAAEAEMLALLTQNKQIKEELEAVRGSVSWRITRPLRVINKILHR